MKILQRDLKHDKMVVLPETLDDIWVLYNVISKGDGVYARTTRLVKMEELYARPKKGKRVPVYLGITAEKVVWERSLNRLRVHGIVCEAPEEIDVTGSHHTINVTADKPVTIVKHRWLKHQIDRLDRASEVTETPIIVMSIDDEQYCVAVLRQYGIDVKVEERTRLPGKLEAEKREKAKREFFKTALRFLRETWMNLRGPIVIIGPGFVKNEFANYVKTVASDIACAVVDVKGVNSAGVSGVHEALRSGVLTKALRHSRIAKEARVMEEALKRLGKGTLDVTYGFNEVEKASVFGAVEKLLLADITLREAPDERRTSLEKLMREVEEKGGQIIVISTEHEAGVKLLSLGGVAALLRFPVG